MAWIVVLVFGFASAVILLVYERRPKLLLSAPGFGQSKQGYERIGGVDRDEGADAGQRWRGVGGGGGARGARRRPRGALTEMVMESEIGLPEASYRLLEDEENDEEGQEHREDISNRKDNPERRSV